MKYAREYKKIAKRIAESAELEQTWKDLEKIYGKKATKQLKELAPADPLLLHDLMVISYLNDGKTKKKLLNYWRPIPKKIGPTIWRILPTQSKKPN